MSEIKIEQLTPEQEAQIAVYREKWIAKLLPTEPHPIEVIEATTKAVYKLSGLKEPEVVVVDSPKEIQDYLNKRLGTKDKFYPYSYYINASDFGWLAFYEYCRDVLGVVDNPDLQTIIDASSVSFAQVQLEDLCVVSRHPKNVKRDEAGRMQSFDGPAVEFANGYKQYYVRGVNIPENVYLKLQNGTFTVEEFIKESNEERKSAYLMFIERTRGSEGLAEFFEKHLKRVDVFQHEPKNKSYDRTGLYELFKGSIAGIDMAFVRCYCPTTDRMFMLSVESTAVKAKDAIASLARFPRKVVNNIKSITRQGEIFVTQYDKDYFENVVKKLTPEECADKVALSGDSYFALMEYEY